MALFKGGLLNSLGGAISQVVNTATSGAANILNTQGGQAIAQGLASKYLGGSPAAPMAPPMAAPTTQSIPTTQAPPPGGPKIGGGVSDIFRQQIEQGLGKGESMPNSNNANDIVNVKPKYAGNVSTNEEGYTKPLEGWKDGKLNWVLILFCFWQVDKNTGLYLLDDKGERKFSWTTLAAWSVVLLVVVLIIWMATKKPKRSARRRTIRKRI